MSLIDYARAQSLEENLDSWYWKITPIEETTVEEDGKQYHWRAFRSDYFPSKKDCLQGIALRLRDEPLQSNQSIACQDFAPIRPDTVSNSWGMRLTYMNRWSKDTDGNIIWHSRIPRTFEHNSREACILEAKKGLLGLREGTGNYEPVCVSPFFDLLSIPIQTINAETLDLETKDLEPE